MGEYADMILEGQMCQWCGEILEGEGFPTLCQACQNEHGVDEHGNGGPEGFPGGPIDPDLNRPAKKPRTHACPVFGCKRKFRSHTGAADHYRDFHNPDRQTED